MENVLVFGTFDIFHPGHKSFLNQAKKLGNLTVVVARDQNVKRAKGSFPRTTEKDRARTIRKTRIADKVVLGSKSHNFYRTIRSNKINIVALGYDQKPSIRELKKDLRQHRLSQVKIVRLRALRPDKYKSSKLLKD